MTDSAALTSSISNTPEREDALFVLRRLRDAGHVAYFAGGCVRDLLLGRTPEDFDIATDAPPTRVQEIFNRTQAVGEAFGVILVRQRRSQVEVATFRTDGRYTDGRRPDEVIFATAEEDAKRRDFTINGLFYDPIKAEVIDFVGGQADLSARQIRAIGNPDRRFEEDHLRLLRAIRFAARFAFTIEPATATAILRHAPMLVRISPERIAGELRLLLVPPTRLTAWRLLHELGLTAAIFRFVAIPPGEPDNARSPDDLLGRLTEIGVVPFSLAMATAAVQWLWWAAPVGRDIREIFEKPAVSRLVQAIRKALRLSNEECDAMGQLLEGIAPLLRDNPPSVATMKRFLNRPTADLSRQFLLLLSGGEVDAARLAWLVEELAMLEKTEFAPPPLITGDDLVLAGMKPSPIFRKALDATYDAQLENQIKTREQALEMAIRMHDMR